MPRIQALPRLTESISNGIPNPDRPIPNSQHVRRSSSPMSHGFSPELLFDCVSSTAGHARSPTQDQRTTSRRFRPLAQSKTNAAVDPVPPVRFLALLAQLISLSPQIGRAS